MLCDCALHITAQETSHHLQYEIKRIVEALPFISFFHGFDVCKDTGDAQHYRFDAYVEKHDSDVECFAKHALAKQAVESMEVQYNEQGEVCLCFMPVTSASDGLQGLWVFSYVKESLQHAKKISLLTQVYQNCVEHIGLQNSDPLTGLKNRQALSDRLSHSLSVQRRSGDRHEHELLNVCMLDIDFFKRVNDDYGHLYGDEVLLLFTGIMKQTFREHDFLYRYGGEEFVVLLNHAVVGDAMIALQRFRTAVESYNFPQVGKVTVSIGFVQVGMGVLPTSALDQADQALYYAKRHGRNQVCCYGDVANQLDVEEAKFNKESELF